MNFDDLNARIKHEGYHPTADEIDAVRGFLDQDRSLHDAESYTAIEIFCRCTEPTRENTDLLYKYISDEVNDYVRSGALTGLVIAWRNVSSRCEAYMRSVLIRLDVDSFTYTIPATFQCAIAFAVNARDASIIDDLVRSYEKLVYLYESDSTHKMLLLNVYSSLAAVARNSQHKFPLIVSESEAYKNSHLVKKYIISIKGLIPRQ